MKKFSEYKVNEEFIVIDNEEDIKLMKVVDVDYKTILKIETSSGRIFYSELKKIQ